MAMFKMPIHIGIDKTENNGLVSDKRLVVRLCVRNRFFVLTTVGHFVEDMSCFPIFVFYFLDILNPEIWYSHCQTVVETYATILLRASKTGHTGHIFRDSDSVFLNLVDKFIGKSEIHDRITIFVTIKV